MGIAERIGGLIEASGVNRHEFAQQAGLDEAKLMMSLSGQRRFSSLDLALVADYCQGRLCQCLTKACRHQFPELCEVTVDWLITGEDPWSGTHVYLCQMPPQA